MCHVHARQRRALRVERVMFAVSQWAEIRARQFGEFPLRALEDVWRRRCATLVIVCAMLDQ